MARQLIMTPEYIAKIQADRDSGMTLAALSEKYGVCQRLIVKHTAPIHKNPVPIHEDLKPLMYEWDRARKRILNAPSSPSESKKKVSQKDWFWAERGESFPAKPWRM